MSAISAAEYQTIISDPNGAELLVKWADKLGQDLKNSKLATNQIRALFGEVRQIEAQWNIDEDNRQKAVRRLILLKPKMAYRARKEHGNGVKELVSAMEPALDEVIREKNPKLQNAKFQRFVEFFEAILAYHKAYGGS